MSNRNMPEDMVSEILLRLPVKSLLRLKCVSKSWSALIINPSFIAKHAAKNNNGRLLVHNYDLAAQKFCFALYPDETLDVPSFQYLDLKLNASARVLGPCNGIFCLFNGINSVALWNTATREFKALPRLPRLDPDLPPEKLIKSLNVFGFGLDSLTNDFKVVWMRTLENMYTDTETEDDDDEDEYNQLCHSVHKAIYVYSLKVDSWRELKGINIIPANFFFSTPFYTYAKGVYYWAVYAKNKYRMILSFNMSDEVFQETSSQGLPEEQPMHSYLALYNDSVAWICPHPNELEMGHCFHIWALKEDHWTKQLIVGPFSALYALAFWKNGELLVQNSNGQLFLSDSSTLQLKDLGTYKAFQAFVYTESLVSLKGDNSSKSNTQIPDFFSTRSPFRMLEYQSDNDSSPYCSSSSYSD